MTNQEAIKELKGLINSCVGREEIDLVCREVIEYLQKQEPRVMTIEELQAIETPWNRNTPPYLFVERRSFADSGWTSWEFMHNCVILPGTIAVKNYGSKWRVWNLQPTPEQMRDTKWEGENETM